MQRGHAEVVKILLKQGADSNKPTHAGCTPLALAAEVSALHGIVMLAVDGAPIVVAADMLWVHTEAFRGMF